MHIMCNTMAARSAAYVAHMELCGGISVGYFEGILVLDILRAFW